MWVCVAESFVVFLFVTERPKESNSVWGGSSGRWHVNCCCYFKTVMLTDWKYNINYGGNLIEKMFGNFMSNDDRGIDTCGRHRADHNLQCACKLAVAKRWHAAQILLLSWLNLHAVSNSETTHCSAGRRGGGCLPEMFSEHLAPPDVTVLFSRRSRTKTYTHNAFNTTLIKVNNPLGCSTTVRNCYSPSGVIRCEIGPSMWNLYICLCVPLSEPLGNRDSKEVMMEEQPHRFLNSITEAPSGTDSKVNTKSHKNIWLWTRI